MVFPPFLKKGVFLGDQQWSVIIMPQTTKKYKLTRVFNFNRYGTPEFRTGDIVKLSFTDTKGRDGESMWVEITHASKQDTDFLTINTVFKGVLDNTSVYGYGTVGDEVKFDLSHIVRKFMPK